jgi:hypothetical protein
LNNGDEDVQIAHPKAPADPAFPIDRRSYHELEVIGEKSHRQFHLCQT